LTLSSKDVFVVGGGDTILHYDGKSWSVMESGEPLYELYSVFGFSGSDVYAAGENVILHYEGSTWSHIQLHANHPFYYGIWGTSPTNLYFIGEIFYGTQFEQGIIEKYDGSTFNFITSPFTAEVGWPILYAVWGSSATDVFFGGKAWGGTGRGVIYHFDGTNWSTCELKENEDNTIRSIWGTSSTDVFAVCESGQIYHYNGEAWSKMEIETQEGYENDELKSIWGYSATDVFALGTQILHYNNAIWSPVQCAEMHGTYLWKGPCSNFWVSGDAIWGSSNREFFAIGGWGNIFVNGVPTTTSTYPSTTSSSTTTIANSCPTESLYGEYAEETELLRYFRDNLLSQTPEGQELIKLYYEWSPVIVKAIEEDEVFKAQVKEMIDGVLPLIR